MANGRTAKTINIVMPVAESGLNPSILDRIARQAGFSTYQAMTKHLLVRIQYMAQQPNAPADTYSLLNSEIVGVVAKAKK